MLQAPVAWIATKWLEKLLTMATEEAQLHNIGEEPILRGASDSETEGEEDIVKFVYPGYRS